MADTIRFLGGDFTESLRNGPSSGPIHDLENPSLRLWITAAAFRRFASEQTNAYVYAGLINEFGLQHKAGCLYCLQEEETEMVRLFSSTRRVICLDSIFHLFPKLLKDKQRRSLMNLSRMNSEYGGNIQSVSRLTFFAKDQRELQFIAESLLKSGCIEARKLGDVYLDVKMTVKGWEVVENESSSPVERQAFIAMSFDPEMNSAYQTISRVLADLQVAELRIDRKEHNNQITDEIMYEIRRSGFVISEVTQHRNGVYFEAGYAMGLGKPVIWVCSKDDFDRVHFDTRQFNHIVWEDLSDLESKLTRRIKGTVL